jgi:hypothetical protein
MENSECIFIGEVFEINNKDLTYKIKVIESLDGGDEIGNIYLGKNWKGCEPFIEEKGKWLIYGHTENGYLRTNMCGISRSFDYPVVVHIPPKPELYKNKSELEKKRLFEKSRTENLKIAKSELELELKALRKNRDEE